MCSSTRRARPSCRDPFGRTGAARRKRRSSTRRSKSPTGWNQVGGAHAGGCQPRAQPHQHVRRHHPHVVGAHPLGDRQGLLHLRAGGRGGGRSALFLRDHRRHAALHSQLLLARPVALPASCRRCGRSPGAAGTVRQGIAGAGLPITNTTMDASTGLPASAGASKDGDAVYLSGTSEVGAIVSGSRTPTPEGSPSRNAKASCCMRVRRNPAGPRSNGWRA